MHTAQGSFALHRISGFHYVSSMTHNSQTAFAFESNPFPSSEKTVWKFTEGTLLPGQNPDAAGWTVSLPLPLPGQSADAERWIGLLHQVWHLLHQYYSNPLTAVTVSRTMLLPHQVEAAVRVVESVRPRFLIADEVGLGKTIEAGLIIKELILKHSFESVLIAVPSPLLYQWQAELRIKFNEHFEVVTGDTLRRSPDLFRRTKKILISVDLAKDERYEHLFRDREWDVVVFDEAHRLRREVSRVTKAWKFAELLSRRSRAFLLLSATPFRGKIEELYYLISLLDPDILGPVHTFVSRFGAGDIEIQKQIAPVVIRRRKVDVGGFTRRFAKTVKLTLSPAERHFYDRVTDYVRQEYNRAMAEGQKLRGFVMITFQKLLDSSAEALLRALRRRKERLEKSYFYPVLNREVTTGWLEDLDEETRRELEEAEEAFLDANEDGVFDPKEVRAEILSLTRLIEAGLRIESEQKFLMLNKTLSDLGKKGHKKFLIFTQFRSTMEFLERELSSRYSVRVFHGAMGAREKEKAIAEFYEDVEILILTEAGGEGRNLQIASVLINYDLPWSPLKIEQRIGRVHRFGQKRDVHIINFATKDTVAERVLEVLETKIKIFEDALGESDTLLGILEDEFNFADNFESFINNTKSKQDLEREIEMSLDLARRNIRQIDKLLSPEVMNFDLQMFRSAGGKGVIRETERGEKLLASIFKSYSRTAGKECRFEGPIMKYKKGSEEKIAVFSHEELSRHENAEYLALGHSLVDSMITAVMETGKGMPVVQAVCPEGLTAIATVQTRIFLDREYRRYYLIGRDVNGSWNFLEPALSHKIRNAVASLFGEKEIATIAESALSFLSRRVNDELFRLKARVHKGVEMLKQEKDSAHQIRAEELDEKLMLQKGKSRWYGEDKMASAITRTVHQKQEEEVVYQRKIQLLETGKRETVSVEFLQICLGAG